MRQKLKNWKVAVCMVTMFIFFSATVSSVGVAAEKELGTKWNPIKLGTLLYYGFLPSWKVVDILGEKKIFAAPYRFPSAVERLEATAAGYLNISYAGVTASIMLSAAGKDIVILAATDGGGRAIVGRKEIKSLKELVGKKVGTTFGSIEHMSLIGELANEGINPKDVEILNFTSAPELPVAMAAGGISAFCTYEPLAQLSLKKYGGHILKLPYYSPMGKINSGVETTRRFIDKYPELTYEVVKAHVQAVEYYNKHPEEALEAAVKTFKIPQDVAVAVQKNNDLAYDLNLGNLKALAKFLKDYGYIKADPDWNKLVDDRFLKRAKKELGLE